MDKTTKDCIDRFLHANPEVARLIREKPQVILDTLSSTQTTPHAKAGRLALSEADSTPRSSFDSAPRPIRKRVKAVAAAPLDRLPNGAHLTFSPAHIRAFCGYSFRFSRVSLNDELVGRLGVETLLALKGYNQPYLPTKPGEPGIYLSSYPRQHTWPKFEDLFCTWTERSSMENAEWTYMGRYELLGERPLDLTTELAVLPQDVKYNLIRYLADNRSGSNYGVRLRARVCLRRDEGVTNPSPQDVDSYLKTSRKDGIPPYVTYRDVSESVGKGLESLYAFVLRPVGYDGLILQKLEEASGREHNSSPPPFTPSTASAAAESSTSRTRKRNASSSPDIQIISSSAPTSSGTQSRPTKRARVSPYYDSDY